MISIINRPGALTIDFRIPVLFDMMHNKPTIDMDTGSVMDNDPYGSYRYSLLTFCFYTCNKSTVVLLKSTSVLNIGRLAKTKTCKAK